MQRVVIPNCPKCGSIIILRLSMSAARCQKCKSTLKGEVVGGVKMWLTSIIGLTLTAALFASSVALQQVFLFFLALASLVIFWIFFSLLGIGYRYKLTSRP